MRGPSASEEAVLGRVGVRVLTRVPDAAAGLCGSTICSNGFGTIMPHFIVGLDAGLWDAEECMIVHIFSKRANAALAKQLSSCVSDMTVATCSGCKSERVV